MTYIEDWFIFLERKQTPFLAASFIKPYHDLFLREISYGFKNQLHIITNGQSFYLRSKKEHDLIIDYLVKIISEQDNDDKFNEWFELGIKFNKWADDEIKYYQKITDKELVDVKRYKKFINNFYNLLFYSTILPYFMMEAAEKAENKNVIEIFAKLRGDTRYPQIIEGVMSRYWEYLSNETSLPVSTIESLLPDEVAKALSQPSFVKTIDKLEQRKKCILGILPDRKLFFDFSKDVIEKFIPHVKEGAKEISGVTACPGIVSGVVKVVNTISDIDKVNKGDIIVSINTSPSIMMAVKKAAGLVTDEGGITCHAAIISRELNIPCVIGTKIATRVFKDGDQVEVNADQGIIKIISASGGSAKGGKKI